MKNKVIIVALLCAGFAVSGPRYQDYEAMGIPGLSLVRNPAAPFSHTVKFGANRDIDAGPETVWANGGLYPWSSIATAQALEVVSTDNVADIAAGTGARTVEIQGLNDQWDVTTQTVTMTGTTAVDLTGTWFRVFRVKVVTAGSTKANVGVISVQLDGAGQVLAIIEATLGQSTVAVYTVPDGYTAYMVSMSTSIIRLVAGSSADVAVFARDNNVVDAAFQVKREFGAPVEEYFHIPLSFGERTDIELRVTAVSAVSTQVTGSFSLVLVKN